MNRRDFLFGSASVAALAVVPALAIKAAAPLLSYTPHGIEQWTMMPWPPTVWEPVWYYPPPPHPNITVRFSPIAQTVSAA